VLTTFSTVHASRDHILLDGNQNYEYEDDEYEDEVFTLKGMDDEEEDHYDEDSEMLEVDDEEQEEISNLEKRKKKKPHSKKGHDESLQEESEEPSEEEEAWGKDKHAYYADNAHELDSDDEEANEMEEQEAKRLQAKGREELVDADFGLDDVPEVSTTEVEECVPPFVCVSQSLTQL
jgi:U3 small nucleolar RNA-associated protein 3